MPAKIKLEIIPLRDCVDNCENATVSKTADDMKQKKQITWTTQML